MLLAAGAGVMALLERREGRRLGREARVTAVLIVLGALTLIFAWLSSQASPAWAVRYLAVALPPVVLLCAAGLAHAGRLGLVGLAVVVVLWVTDGAPTEKSNVRAVAEAIGPSLAPGDLVDLHAARGHPGAAPLPAAGAALRDGVGARSRTSGSATGATASKHLEGSTVERNLAAAARQDAARSAARAGRRRSSTTRAAGRRRGPRSFALARSSGPMRCSRTAASRSPRSRRPRSPRRDRIPCGRPLLVKAPAARRMSTKRAPRP